MRSHSCLTNSRIASAFFINSRSHSYKSMHEESPQYCGKFSIFLIFLLLHLEYLECSHKIVFVCHSEQRSNEESRMPKKKLCKNSDPSLSAIAQKTYGNLYTDFTRCRDEV